MSAPKVRQLHLALSAASHSQQHVIAFPLVVIKGTHICDRQGQLVFSIHIQGPELSTR